MRKLQSSCTKRRKMLIQSGTFSKEEEKERKKNGATTTRTTAPQKCVDIHICVCVRVYVCVNDSRINEQPKYSRHTHVLSPYKIIVLNVRMVVFMEKERRI